MFSLEEVADRLAIQSLYSRYCFAIDGNDGPGLADCFAEDGVFAVSGRGRFVGRGAIAQLVRDTADTRPRHMYLNLWIEEVAADRARARAYFLLVDKASGANTAYGHYEDSLVRDAGDEWRWTERQIVFEWTSEAYAARGRAAVESS